MLVEIFSNLEFFFYDFQLVLQRFVESFVLFAASFVATGTVSRGIEATHRTVSGFVEASQNGADADIVHIDAFVAVERFISDGEVIEAESLYTGAFIFGVVLGLTVRDILLGNDMGLLNFDEGELVLEATDVLFFILELGSHVV